MIQDNYSDQNYWRTSKTFIWDHVLSFLGFLVAKQWLKIGPNWGWYLQKSTIWSFYRLFWLIQEGQFDKTNWITSQIFMGDHLHWCVIISRLFNSPRVITNKAKLRLKIPKKYNLKLLEPLLIDSRQFIWSKLLGDITSYHLRSFILICHHFEPSL